MRLVPGTFCPTAKGAALFLAIEVGVLASPPLLMVSSGTETFDAPLCSSTGSLDFDDFSVKLGAPSFGLSDNDANSAADSVVALLFKNGSTIPMFTAFPVSALGGSDGAAPMGKEASPTTGCCFPVAASSSDVEPSLESRSLETDFFNCLATASKCSSSAFAFSRAAFSS